MFDMMQNISVLMLFPVLKKASHSVLASSFHTHTSLVFCLGEVACAACPELDSQPRFQMPNDHVMVMAPGPCRVVGSQLVAYRQDFKIFCIFLIIFSYTPHSRETVIVIY